MKRFIGLMFSLTLLTGILTGCAQSPADNGTTTPTENPAQQTQTPEAPEATEVPEASDSPDASAEAWPRTIEDALGKQITLEKKPERIALLDFGYIEILFALDMTPIASTFAERSLNGFGTLQLYAADAQIEELGENKAPNLEKLAELEPDLILYTAEAENLDTVLYEAASQIATVVTFDSPDWKAQLRAFGKCLGAEERAEEYISEIEAMITQSQEALSAYSDKTVAVLFERSSDVGNFVVIASGENPVWFDKENGLGLTPPDNYPETQEMISLEGVAALNPDYIFLCGALGTEANGYKQSHLSEETQASSVWQSLNAVKNGQVYYLDAAVRAAGPLGIKLGIETIVESITE